MMGDLGKLIVAKGFKKLTKVQKIARSGHIEDKQKFFLRSTLCWKYLQIVTVRQSAMSGDASTAIAISQNETVLVIQHRQLVVS